MKPFNLFLHWLACWGEIFNSKKNRKSFEEESGNFWEIEATKETLRLVFRNCDEGRRWGWILVLVLRLLVHLELGDVERLVDDLRDGLDLRAQLLLDAVKGEPVVVGDQVDGDA